MSFFSKTQIGELKRNNEKIIRIAVSNVPINPTIAITTSNKIHLYNECGEKHMYELSRAITPTAIEWHPFNPILAIGWDNGRITIWNEDTKAPKEEGKPHYDPIMMIRFNPTGSRMVTSDLTGTIGVWRGINLLAVYQKEWAITHCVFSDLHLEGIKGNLGNLFLFAGRSGTVCLANDMNMCSDVCRVGGTIKALMFYQKQGSAIVITSNLLLVQFKINFTEKSVPEKKVKLSISGEPENLSSIWIGESLLSTSSNQNMIRFWHLEQDQNYNLTVFDVLNSESSSNLGSDKIANIVYDARGRSLVAGTREGNLLFWKNMALGTDSPLDKDQWSPQPFLNLGKQIQLLTVGKNNGVIVCKQSDKEVIIVSETRITGRISGNYSILLKSSDTIQIKYEDQRDKITEKYVTGNHVKGVDLSGDHLLYWNNKTIQILAINKDDRLSAKTISSIQQKPIKCMFAGRDSIMITTDFGLNHLALNGTVKQSLTFPESEGKVMGIDVLGTHLVMWTQSSYLRIFQIGAEIKPIAQSRRFQDSKGLIGHIKSCSINSTGHKVGIISNKATSSGSSVNHWFHIYDTENDSFVSYDLGKETIPVLFFWDRKEHRYFGIQAEVNKISLTKPQNNNDSQEEDRDEDTDKESKDKQEEVLKTTTREFFTFFYTFETGIRYQDKYSLKSSILDIFALKVPHFYSTERVRDEYYINKAVLHDFHKINTDDEIIRTSILNFSFHLTSGNLDEAYKSVKNIQSSAIWEKMAIMCVKSKRLDVAEICIGNMKFARGARSIRQAKKEPQLQSQLGMVALQLGMIDEAKQLYEESQRYDLLSKLCQANGEIDKAIEISDKCDRINLKNSYYSAAKFYEAQGKYEEAIQFFEKSNTYIKEVPRMMLQAHKIDELQEYVEEKKEKQLYTWMGQYKQSIGQIEEAKRYYEIGESSSNLVRLHLSQNQLQDSIRICNSQSEPQACFLLARHMEKIGMLSEAIHFYAKAQYYSQAIKIAINNELDGEIVSLSMASPKQVALRSASYFERKGLFEKAIRLYQKAGATKKGNGLAEKHGFTELISLEIPAQESEEEEDLINGGDKGAIQTRANHLIESGKYQRAVPLLVSVKQYQKALDICMQYNVPIHDDLVKKMVPEDEPSNPMERSKRNDLMKTLAEKCRKQGSFEMASNLYVRLADKQKAIKCLIELGDSNKVIMFANNARSAQTYILAANFLQTADWHQNPELMKNIISFYSKAKAYDNLAGFFEACSNVEIDEYRDYDKASAALKEALKHMGKSTSPDRQARIANITYRKKLIDRFIELKEMAQTDPRQMVNEYLTMLEEPDIEQSVRRGDIFAIVIEYHFQMGEFDKCLKYLKQMKEKGIIITPYIDKEIIETTYRELGISSKPKQEDMVEEVIEDIS